MPAPPIERRSAAAETPVTSAAYIAATVDACPSLTAAQRDRLSALLRPAGGGSDVV